MVSSRQVATSLRVAVAISAKRAPLEIESLLGKLSELQHELSSMQGTA